MPLSWVGLWSRLYFKWLYTGQFPGLISLLNESIFVLFYWICCFLAAVGKRKRWRKKATCTDNGNDNRLFGDPLLRKFYAQTMWLDGFLTSPPGVLNRGDASGGWWVSDQKAAAQTSMIGNQKGEHNSSMQNLKAETGEMQRQGET